MAAELVPLTPHVFSGKRWSPVVASADAAASSALAPGAPAALTLLTWNVWFGRHKFAARAAALLDELTWRSPDIIALQEVTWDLLEVLLASPFLRASYQVSDVDGSSFERYGVLLLSRLPLSRLAVLPLPSAMGRRLLLGTLGNGLTIGTIHLESTAACAEQRALQLRLIQPALHAASGDFVLMGDMNFSPDAALENGALAPTLDDVWARLHPELPGFTVDSQHNAMRRRFDDDPVGRRIDRVFVHSQRWRAQAISLTGVSAIDSSGTFVSDHFGLETVIEPRS
ncbi:MAG: endonuclease/exonuclease/phosphatase family protein [Myxococcales bacterium]|nr:endonuclease/exonuclease/phosphatase family protein [Myxococcales bacterium]